VPTESEPRPDLREAIGGPLGMAESALPAVAFVVAYTASGQNTDLAAIVAVGLALVLTLVRLAKRETPRHAISGLVGVGFAAFVATRTGRAEDFFLPGLLANAGYGAAFIISIAVRRPIVGYIVTQLDGSAQTDWRSDRRRMTAFIKASWIWAALFLIRLTVQLPLYIAGAVVALGVARTAMGLPLFALGLWLSWLLARRAPAPPAPA
jgi:hypothetical protein